MPGHAASSRSHLSVCTATLNLCGAAGMCRPLGTQDGIVPAVQLSRPDSQLSLPTCLLRESFLSYIRSVFNSFNS